MQTRACNLKPRSYQLLNGLNLSGVPALYKYVRHCKRADSNQDDNKSVNLATSFKMVIGQLISDDIPPLKTNDSAEKALTWMDEFKVSWLPVVNGTEFVGIISES